MATRIAELRHRIHLDRNTFLGSLTGAVEELREITLSVQIDEDVTKYEKGIEKEYAFRHSRDLSEDFHALIDCEIVDFGWDTGAEEFARCTEEGSPEMTLHLEWHAPSTDIVLRGWFYGDAGPIEYLGNGLKARLKLVGPRKGRSELSLYQDLLLEALGMERMNNRLALFLYFSAAECAISNSIYEYKASVATELHHALEHLTVAEKLTVSARNALGVAEVGEVEIWGEAMSALMETARLRNRIAHPHERCEVSPEAVDRAFLAFQLVHSMLVDGHSTAHDILDTHGRPLKTGGSQGRASSRHRRRA